MRAPPPSYRPTGQQYTILRPLGITRQARTATATASDPAIRSAAVLDISGQPVGTASSPSPDPATARFALLPVPPWNPFHGWWGGGVPRLENEILTTVAIPDPDGLAKVEMHCADGEHSLVVVRQVNDVLGVLTMHPGFVA
jgi:hypothetical protein